MTPERLLARLPAVPYEVNGRGFSGCDCWGLVEIWYQHILGIDLKERQGQLSEPAGFADGFGTATNWIELDAPQNHAVAVMVGHMNGQTFTYGHCGVIFEGRVYHFHRHGGFQHSSVSDRLLRITAVMGHKQCSKS